MQESKNNNLNLVEILKDCPRGKELYSPLFGECTFLGMQDKGIDTCIYVVSKKNNMQYQFYSDGKYIRGGECVLFPSKDQRDWNNFRKELVPPFEVYRNKNGSYFYVESSGLVLELTDSGSIFDNNCWFSGNYFNFREQADYAASKRKSLFLSLRVEEES